MQDNESIRRLVATYGTPLYVYNRQCIIDSVRKVRDAFPGFEIIYSVKANPYEPILQLLKDQDVGIDAASKNEALSAARLGFSDIYYSAPGKSAQDVSSGLKTSHLIADSFRELRLINEAAAANGTIAEAGIRLNIPNPGMQASRFEVMGAAASKFGVDVQAFIDAASEVRAMKHLRINGLHVYFGSQLTDAQLVAENFSSVSRAAEELLHYYPLEYINYGGGFGVPYELDEAPLDLCRASELILSDTHTRAIGARGIRRNIELGRYLVAEAGLYVSTVADVKRSGGVTFVILDGGMNIFFRPKFTGQTHRVGVISAAGGEYENPKMNATHTEKVRLVGNTCTPLDVFYEDIDLPPLEPGDLLTFANAGAYGYSMSLLEFISFDRPAQIMTDEPIDK